MPNLRYFAAASLRMSSTPSAARHRLRPGISFASSRLAYRLKYIHAASANKTIIAIQRDESLIPVFLAMNHILSPTSRLCGTIL